MAPSAMLLAIGRNVSPVADDVRRIPRDASSIISTVLRWAGLKPSAESMRVSARVPAGNQLTIIFAGRFDT